jgi:hypothetical protein
MFYAASKIKYGKPDPAKMFGVGRMEKLAATMALRNCWMNV